MHKRLLALLLTLSLLFSFGMISATAEQNVGGEITTTPVKQTTVPSRITISGSHEVAVGKSVSLNASVAPSKASQKVTWKTSNKKIAKVDSNGKVTGVKAGKVTITAVSKAKKTVKQTWTVTVKTAVKKITITAPRKTIDLSNSKVLQLKVKVSPSGASKAVTWKSSDKSIATVSSKGKVVAKKPGTVTITAKAKDGSGKKASIKIKVIKKSSSGTKYRALLIGEKTFLKSSFSYETWQYEYSTDIANRNVGDAKNMATMLGGVKGPEGSKYAVTRKTDLTYSGVKNAIKNTFKDTTSDDVSLFFFASHGNSDGDGELVLAFTGDPKSSSDREKYWEHNYIGFDTLASWLKQYVKGKVIVIIESCGAGSAIYDPEEENGANGPVVKNLSAAEKDAAAAKLAKQAVRAFSNADSRVDESNSTGDLRNSKFYVLACSRHHEMSWGTEVGPYNYFTKWLIDGVGKIGSSPADKQHGNSDGYVTLTELFKYISYVGDDCVFDIGDGNLYYQHVQRYPVGSSYKLFKVK